MFGRKKLLNEIDSLQYQLQQKNQELTEQKETQQLNEKEIKSLKEQLSKIPEELFIISDLDNTIKNKESQLQNLNLSILNYQKELKDIKSDLIEYSNERTAQSLGFYSKILTKYWHDSEEIERQIKELRSEIKSYISNKLFYKQYGYFVHNNSEAKGRAMIEKMCKIAITAFNLNVDALLEKINISNVESIKQKIIKNFDSLNKQLSVFNSELTRDMLNFRIKEIELRYALAVRKEEEKDAKRQERERLKQQEKEEKELQKELDKLYDKLDKEYHKENVDNNIINSIQEEINKAEHNLKNKKAGYVYIVKNMSFSENIYKVGTTKRESAGLRIKELYNASVPYKFLPVCIIYSEDCYALESALHKEFDKYRVNKINKHKEFFQLPLEEIEKIIKQKYVSNAKFNYDIEDEDWILSQNLIDNEENL